MVVGSGGCDGDDVGDGGRGDGIGDGSGGDGECYGGGTSNYST